MIHCWLGRKRRDKKIAEYLSVANEVKLESIIQKDDAADKQTLLDDEEINRHVAVLELKMQRDKVECMQTLDEACQVKEEKGKSL